ncbi:hypothetical protein Nepgr_000022 [Nepenthes gracilis]|uniref:Bis(5'-adenosyl)-triphosphatase n=1 Tax=Nepenthes gracilis TaxID=150966 RepID=A0AAD3P309_NEPGR|nr:hypothetical protein Nepgr_000022 [Nepenthes gracilis]
MVMQHLVRRLLVTSLADSSWRRGGGGRRRRSLITLAHSSPLRRLQPFPTRLVLSSQMASEYYTFGPYKIDQKEVFYFTDLSYAMVNLRPLLPGHILHACIAVTILHEVKRFVDLTAAETSDLWLTAQKVASRLEHYHEASSVTFTIQDGPQAGQTVPHVHIHILPRKAGDFEKNDEIYDAIDLKEKELAQKLDLDTERMDRSPEEMAEEANEYRRLFS